MSRFGNQKAERARKACIGKTDAPRRSTFRLLLSDLGEYAEWKPPRESDLYAKIVWWSDEDGCYVGRCPGLFFGGVHGDDEKQVYAELCDAVEETIQDLKVEGRPLPPPTIGLLDTLMRRGVTA